MERLSKDEKERIKKLNNTSYYNIGYEYSQNICSETDKLLEEYKDLDIPDSLNDWFDKHVVDIEKEKRMLINKKRRRRVLKRVALFFMVFGVFTVTITMNVEAFRIKFFNVINVKQSEYSTVKYSETKDVDYVDRIPESWGNIFYISQLPDGYRYYESLEANNSRYIVFINEVNEKLLFCQHNVLGGYQVDSQGSNMSEVIINGKTGFLFDKDGRYILNWLDDDNSFYLEGSIDVNLMIKLAESIKEKK